MLKTTIINYDKDNDSLSWIFNLKKELPNVSAEVENLFSKVNKKRKLSELLGGFYDSKDFKDTDFNDWISGLDDVEKSSLNAGEALEKYKTHLESVGKTTTVAAKAMSGLKQVGSVLASMGTAFLVSEGITLALKAIDDYTHQYTRALENASTAYLPRRY